MTIAAEPQSARMGGLLHALRLSHARGLSNTRGLSHTRRRDPVVHPSIRSGAVS